MSPPPLILASVSPRRAELLNSLGVAFEILPSGAEEAHDEGLGMVALCEMNAGAKARDVALRNPGACVVGADTLVGLGEKLYGKPRDLEDARRMLRELAGKTHKVVTGVCLVHHESGREERFSDCTEVRFRTFGEDVIEEYIRTVPVLDKAGAYGIQERGELLVDRVAGSLSNVIGLPTEMLGKALERWGYSIRRR